MRIAGYIPHPTYKITILHMNARFDVKIEYLGMEQHYKIRESESINSAHQVQELFSKSILENVDNIFESMKGNMSALLPASNDEEEIVEGII